MDRSASKSFLFHFDVRNTVLVADSVTNVSVEESLNSYLTSVAWGVVDTPTGRWSWCCDEPTLDKPRSDAVSYYKYLESKIVRNPVDRIKFRKVTGQFTRTEIGFRFKHVYDRYIQLLECSTNCHANLRMKGSTKGKFYHYLLPSFVKFLHYLNTYDVTYKIIFRTFGLDAPAVLKAVDLVVNCNRSPSSGVYVSHKIDSLTRRDDEIVLNIGGETKIRDESEIQGYLSKFRGNHRCRSTVSAITDDFHWWLKNEYLHTGGKPMWLDSNENDEFQQIFFDDNIRFEDFESIVDVRISAEKQKFVSVNQADFIAMKNVHLVQVDLLEAIENLDYFIEKFLLCNRNYLCKSESSIVW